MSKAETIRTGRLGKRELRLARMNGRYYGLVDGRPCTEGDEADDVWRRLHDDVGKTDPKYFGFDGARSRFSKFFPGGFHAKDFTAAERDFKLAAKAKLDLTAPLERAVDGTGYGEAVRAVINADMIHRVEATRLHEALRGPHADDFIRAAARFTLDGGKSNLKAMEQALKPHKIASWTAVTYLPFLWRPVTHIFLKPEVTKDFAVRVGHPFAEEYKAQLDIAVYESLLDLATRTERELADMRPRDRIDIQSFLWTVGAYKEDSETVTA